MRRHPKAPAVGSILGTGSSRARFGGAFATRGASGDADGSGAPSRRLTTFALALLCAALLASLFALPAQASKVVLGNFGSGGSGLGQFSATNSPRGIAVNTTGNGGVPAGTVYVADFSNHRIDQFTASGAPVRAWGNKVVFSGQHLAAPANAVQSLTVTATAGKYKLKFSGSETGELPFSATASEIQTALRALPSIGGPGANTNVTVTGTGPYTITFGSTLTNSPEPAITVESGPGEPLTGGTATISVVNLGATGFTTCEAPPSNDVCQPGTQTALAGGLGGPTGVAVDQATGNVYVTEQNNRRVSKYTATGVWIATWGLDVVKFGQDNTGAGFEVCKANSNPVDICQSSSGGSVAGAFAASTNLQSGIAVDPTTNNVYVADQGNNRVQEFGASGAFLKAIGADVVTDGATGTGTLNGTNTISSVVTTSKVFEVGQTITSGSDIPPGTTITAVGAGTITLSNAATGSGTLKPLTAAPGTENVPSNEKQTVSLSGPPTGGTFTLTYTTPNPSASTATATAIPFNASAAALEAKLAGLTNLGAENVAVSGPDGGPWVVEFKGARFADTDVAQMTGTASLTPSGAVTVSSQNGLETCTVATDCRTGAGGTAVGQFGPATGASRLAVDTNGNVYVVDFINQRVQKFTPGGGTYTASLFGPSGPTAAPFAVAVDPVTNNVLIGRQNTIGGISEMRVEEYGPAGGLLDTHGIGGKVSEGTASSATSGNLALNTVNGNIYLDAISSSPKVHILNEVPAPPPPIVLPATGVTATTAELHGKVIVPAPGGDNFDTKYRFEYSVGGGDWVSAPIPDGNVGNVAGSHDVGATVSGLEPNSKYVVRLAATTSSTVRSTSEVTFTTSVAPPIVSVTHVENVTEIEAGLTALVNPRHLATTYYFKWGRTSSYGHQIPTFKRQLGSGGTAIVAQDTISGLEPDTNYHFQIVTENSAGEKTIGPDHQFFTRMPLNEWGLPDDRGAEMVSPADKRPSGVVGTLGADDVSLFGKASTGGNAFTYPLINGVEGSTTGGLLRHIGDRTSTGWQSAQLSPPSLVAPYVDGLGVVKPSKILIASPDLSCGLVETRDPLTSDTSAISVAQGVTNLYVWHRGGNYELVTNRIPLNPSALASAVDLFYDQFDIADDCSRVFFKSNYQFLPDASGLYEWEEGELRDGGVRPDSTAFAGSSSADVTVVGGEALSNLTSRWNAVTPEDSLFFNAISSNEDDFVNGKRAVFLRKDGGGPGNVINVSRSQTTVPTNGARFEAASADGSHVFFRANYGIAATSSSGLMNGACGETNAFDPLQKVETGPCDLYAYEVTTGELTDLSADTNPNDTNGATVAGVVAVDEDGSHVYFAALGQLIPGKGKTYAENLQGNRSANIYLSHDGELSYVTNLSQHLSESAGDLLTTLTNAETSAVLLRNSVNWSAFTSADGNRLLFTSASKSITGYDSGGLPELYLYNHGPENPGTFTCVSCPPDGSPSLGSAGGRSPVNGGGVGFFRGRQAVPVFMSEDGRRIFFNSKNVLAPGGTSGAHNIYEWEDGNVYFLAIAKPSAGSGSGGYVDASASGDDVFIATSEKLAPQDIDNVSDIYDLRVGGGFPAAVIPYECDPAADECQGVPTPQPPAGSAPPSAEFQGAGNPAPEKPKCRKGQVLKKGKCVRRPHRKKATHKTKTGKAGKSRTANSNRGGVK